MGVEYKDYYKILGVEKNASADEINRAYKKLARKHHPDLNQGDKKSEERFKDLNEAHEVLKDPEKRKLYDQLGPNWQDGRNFRRPPGFENVRFEFGGMDGASGFSDFFESLFGGGRQGFSGSFGSDARGFSGSFGGGRARRGRDMETGITLSLEEAFHGGRKTVSLSGGPGTAPRSLEVNIPAGIRSGARIRLGGQGGPGNQGAPAGDLFLKVNIAAHPEFSLDDADVLYDLRLPAWDAALGVRVTIPTLAGKVELNVAPGTSSGKKLRLRGKGLGSGKNKGDQIVRISIDVPAAASPEMRRLWEALRITADGTTP
ncbi:MAG: J domain-containing protein [Desulfovibrio sp.]|nr:J domain-containing protein [Desulfovibrio sp.]